jgi:hypothetical protein
MRHDEENAPMSPAERRLAIAGILASAILRLRDRAALPDEFDPHEKASESGEDRLAFAPESLLTDHVG